MKSRTLKKVFKLEVDSVSCNCCGRVIDTSIEEVIQIGHYFGYCAQEFDDGEVHEVDVCEPCYKKWVGVFKIPPTEGAGEDG